MHDWQMLDHGLFLKIQSFFISSQLDSISTSNKINRTFNNDKQFMPF